MDRASAVIALLELQRPLPELVADLASFPWDSEHELASLSPRHVQSVLRRFIEDALSAAEVEAWANALEGRDDVTVPDRVVQDALNELANPELTQALTVDRARQWLLELRA